jgi:SpoVK/Ycf46/Vps4 family AAA+-type ATPase
VRTTVENIIAEEKKKQHTVLADRLFRALRSNENSTPELQMEFRNGSKGREFIAEITPRREISDIILSDTNRTLIKQIVEEQQRSSLLRAHGLDPRHSILLIGPPGNGKTSLAEAVAAELAVPFFVVRYESMIGSFLGETAGRLKKIFEYVRTTPCVLFFDEFDAIGKERGDTHETGEIKRVVTSLLMQIDELPSYTVIIAATNHSELLDRAVWRRFQLRLELPFPDQEGLALYFQKSLGLSESKSKVTGMSIAKRLGRISYAEAEEFVLDVRRQDIMAMHESSLEAVLKEQLKLWETRVQPSQSKGAKREIA